MVLHLLLLPFFSLFLIQSVTSQETCRYSCSPESLPVVRFPFALGSGNHTECSSYPGFNDLVSCNRSSELQETQLQTVFKLPAVSTNFITEFIDYSNQMIHIQDPESCLAKHFLTGSGFDLSGTPFASEFHRTFAFLNCSANYSSPAAMSRGVRQVPCLSTGNFTVLAVLTSVYEHHGSPYMPQMCKEIKTRVPVPVFWPVWAEGYTRLLWYNPNCLRCENSGGICRFKNQESLQLACANLPVSTGFSRTAKYGMIVGIGIPGLMCIIGFCCYLGTRVKAYGRRRRPVVELSGGQQRSITIAPTGLDGVVIESFPKTEVGESRRLPNPSDNTCPICLSDYKSKDTLRSIPECNHYFHADCIDEWLKMNGTCPLCRNSPQGSSTQTKTTPSTSAAASLSPSGPSPSLSTDFTP